MGQNLEEEEEEENDSDKWNQKIDNQNIDTHICIHIQLSRVSLFFRKTRLPRGLAFASLAAKSSSPWLSFASANSPSLSSSLQPLLFSLLLNHTLFHFLLHHSLLSLHHFLIERQKKLNGGGQTPVCSKLFLCNSFCLQLSPLNHGFLIPFPHSISGPERSHKLC